MKIHLDLDCFFAAAHRINHPELENIPIAVGGKSNVSIFDTKKHIKQISDINGAFSSSIISESTKSLNEFEEYFIDKKGKIRGIVTTSSYEARKFGIKTAMPVAQALQICPQLKMIPPDYTLYHNLSKRLKILLEKEIPIIEQFSIDEFFGDITGWIEDNKAYEFGKYLQKKIKDELALPISIGIAKTKWIAKLATTAAKPMGVKLVKDDELEAFINPKQVSEFPGIGKVLQCKLAGYGIKTLYDLKQRKDLICAWGKNEKQIYNRVCATDNDTINVKEDKKSIGLGRSFDPIFERAEIQRRLTILCRHLSFIAHKGHNNPTAYKLKIKYQYGLVKNAAINTNRVFSELNLKHEIGKLFNSLDSHPTHAIVHITISLESFQETSKKTYDLFSYEDDTKQSKLSDSMQELRDKFGIDIIKNGNEF